MVLWTSLSPPPPDSILVEPMLSISSMKMMLGACSLQVWSQDLVLSVSVSHLAITNSSLTIRLPSPMNFCTSSEPDTL